MGRLFGLLLAVLAVPALFLNEGRAVRTARSLEEGAAVVAHVEATPIKPGNDGKLVHFTGLTATGAVLRDPLFGVEAKALQLSRRVEMFQWKHTTRGRSSTRPPDADDGHAWADHVIDKSDVQDNPSGRENPPMPYQAETQTARDVTVGDYQVPQRTIHQLDGGFTPLPLDPAFVAAMPNLPTGKPKFYQGNLYFGEDPSQPQVGDVKVYFSTKGLGEISVVGRQQGKAVEPYPTKAGRDVEIARMGSVGARDMFDGEMTTNTFLTWLIRIGGFLLMYLGTSMLFKLRGLLRFIPVFGSLYNAGAGLLAFGLASVASVATIAFAWIAYRPLLGLTLLGVAGAVGFVMWKTRQQMPATAAR